MDAYTTTTHQSFFFVFTTFKLLAEPLEVFADVIPFLGDLVGAGSMLIAFLAASIVSLVVIALSWLFYRPFLSLFILGIVGGLVYLVRNREKLRNSGDGYFLLSKKGSP